MRRVLLFVHAFVAAADGAAHGRMMCCTTRMDGDRDVIAGNMFKMHRAYAKAIHSFEYILHENDMDIFNAYDHTPQAMLPIIQFKA